MLEEARVAIDVTTRCQLRRYNQGPIVHADRTHYVIVWRRENHLCYPVPLDGLGIEVFLDFCKFFLTLSLRSIFFQKDELELRLQVKLLPPVSLRRRLLDYYLLRFIELGLVLFDLEGNEL